MEIYYQPDDRDDVDDDDRDGRGDGNDREDDGRRCTIGAIYTIKKDSAQRRCKKQTHCGAYLRPHHNVYTNINFISAPFTGYFRNKYISTHEKELIDWYVSVIQLVIDE